jgi:alpha-L-fucosidase
MRHLIITLFFIIIYCNNFYSQNKNNFAVIKLGESINEIIRKAANVVPSPQQYSWQEREFIAFMHFGINTFTEHEWGEGKEDPSLFNPTDFNAEQWANVCKDASMKMIILTAKHHDGFCLWPSEYTEHSVKNSPWRKGKGDVVQEVSNACKKFGLKFGVYLSPWDRHEQTYGDSPIYNEHFRNQLRELLTNYGEVSEVWFDGACGEGPNGKKQVYDWQSYYKVIRELQPNAVIFGMAPDVRWVGTESGYGRETEWSVIPYNIQNIEAIEKSNLDRSIDNVFEPSNMMDSDLGSREKLKNASTLIWYPSETDVSIRPGWFYHENQDSLVKTPEELVDIYYSSVGRNSVLLLNIPPDKRGRIHNNDIKSLMGMRRILEQTFKTNFADKAKIKASNEQNNHRAIFILDKDKNNYWTTDDGMESATLEFELEKTHSFDCIMLREYIRVGQRVEEFHLDKWNGNEWKEFARGTTIGYKRLLRFLVVTTNRLRLVIEKSRTNPTLSSFGLYKSPP